MRIPDISVTQFNELASAIRIQISAGYQMDERSGRGDKEDTDGYSRASKLHFVIDNHVVDDGRTSLSERESIFVPIIEALLLSSSNKLKSQVCTVVVKKFVEFGLVSEASMEEDLKYPIRFTGLRVVEPYKSSLSQGDLQAYEQKLAEYNNLMIVDPKWEAASNFVASGLSQVGRFFSSIGRRNSGGAAAASSAATASSETLDTADAAMRPGTPGSA